MPVEKRRKTALWSASALLLCGSVYAFLYLADLVEKGDAAISLINMAPGFLHFLGHPAVGLVAILVAALWLDWISGGTAKVLVGRFRQKVHGESEAVVGLVDQFKRPI